MSGDPDIASDGGLRLTIAPPVADGPVRDPRFAPSENLGPRYAQARIDRDVDSYLQRIRQRAGGGAGSGPALPAGQAPPPATSPGAPPAFPPTTGAPLGPGEGSLPQPGADEALGAGAAALRDLGRGVTQTPRAMAGGALDALRELGEAGSSFGGWLSETSDKLTGFDGTVPIPDAFFEALRLLPGQRVYSKDFLKRVAADPFDAFASLVPDLGKPDTVSAGMVHDVTQFLVGFAAGGKALKAAGALPKVATRGAAAPAGLAKGAFSDALAFDPKDENLAALLKKHAGLKDPVTTFLATDPNDNEALNRLRRSLEGLGLGAATEGLALALRAYRARKAASVEADGGRVDPATLELERQRALHGSLEADAFKALGDAADTGPLARKATDAVAATDTNVSDALTAQAVAGAAPPVPEGIARIAGSGPKLIVNFARIAAPDDVKAVLRDAAEAFKGDIDAARRGVQSHDDTKALADALGMTVDDLLARRRGQPLNAEEALAARRLWVASTEKLLELARVAASPQASPVDLFAFRRMLATHYAIQSEVMAARTETARALNAWKIPADGTGGIERSRAVTDALVQTGGDETARDMARRLSVLADSGVDAGQLSAFARRGAFATSSDAIREVFINGLLSSPTTHLVNVSSNSLTAAMQIAERRIAENLSALRGGADGVAPGEALAMAHGLIAANRDAWRLAWMALVSGDSGQALATAAGRTMDQPRLRAIAAEPFGLGDDALGRTVDALGEIVRVPSRLLGAEDEFFKAIGYRMELHAQALRQARSENLAGHELSARVSRLVADPPEHIRLAAADQALYQTFTQHAGAVGEALMATREAIPGAFVVLPFVKTPVNIFRYSLERTPLAPLVDSWRADIAHGGARRDIAMARLAMGSSIMLAALDYADRGLISGSGPSEPQRREALERTGWKKYSVFVDGKWVAYDRADPMGMLMGFAADFAEMMRKADVEPDKMDDASEILAAGIAAIAQVTVDKTYLRGSAQFFAAMEDPRRNAFNWVGSTAAGFVPFGAAIGYAKNLDDPVQRERMVMFDFVQARLVGFSQGLTPRRDLWGKEVAPDSGYGAIFDATSPVKVSRVKPSPIDQEMVRLGIGIERIDKKSNIAGVPINFRDWPKEYDFLVRSAGNELKLAGFDMGAKELLDAMVEGKGPLGDIYRQLSDGPEGGKATQIRKIVRQARQQARAALMERPEFTAFQAHVEEQRRTLQEKRWQLDTHYPFAREPGGIR